VAWLKSNGGRTTMDSTFIELKVDYTAIASHFFCNVVDNIRTRDNDYRWGKEDACELLLSASDVFRTLSEDEWIVVKHKLQKRYLGK
jgi:hypothetical protein